MINIVRHKSRCFQRKIFYSDESWTHSQSFQVFSNKKFPPFSSPEDLALILKEMSMHVDEGRNTLYLPPQPGIKDALGEIVDWYPENSGFKILKRFANLENARYINVGTTYLINYLMGGIETQALAQSCLYALGVGPKLFDITQLNLGKVDLTIMVVEHCQGHFPSLESGEQFLNLLKELKTQGFFQLVNPSGLNCKDFTPPDCNKNLLINPDNRFCYIDPQQFLFDKHKVCKEVLKQTEQLLHCGKYLYQNSPRFTKNSKRETEYRWNIILDLMQKHAIDLSGRVVFDVWCNSGMKVALCLAKGAMWGMGWDLPEIAATTEKILAVQGFTRFQAVDCKVSETFDLTADIPGWLRKHTPGSILFFKDAWQHLGFPHSIADMDWDWLFYEGTENNDEARTQEKLECIKRDCQCIDLETIRYRDGAGTPQQLVVCKRISS